MARLDERLKQELDRAARPADPSGVYEHLIRRKERRRIVRKAQSGALAVVVIAGSVAGFYGLTRVFGGGDERTPLGPAAANGLLALTVQEDQTRHSNIFTLTPDGSRLDKLTAGPELDMVVAWAPDGRRIAFWRTYPEEPSGIWVADADGTDAHPILETELSIADVAWSPDGSRIAFAGSELPEGDGTELDIDARLYVMNSDGTELVPITTKGQVTAFGWSPDGDRFVVERRYGIGETRLGYSLSVMNADGTGETSVTADDLSRDPSWSPDGSSIVFVGSASGRLRDPDLFLVAPDGSGLRQLTDDSAVEEDPVWSPDGTRIAFVRFPQGDRSECELVVMDADGSNATTIADKQALGGCPLSIAWQPIADDEAISPLPSPSATPTPTESPSRPAGEDIGLGFPVCRVSSVRGRFADAGTLGTAFVATKAGDTGGCPDGKGADHLVAVDVSGDGLADATYGPIECDPICSAFATPDVDGDGTDELLIQNIQFSIAGLRLYEVRADPPEVFPVTVSTPGYPEGGLPPGLEPQLWLGGDAFQIDTLRCETTAEGRVLIQVSASEDPPDSPESVLVASETTFRLDDDGTVAVVGHRSFEEPTDGDPSFVTEGGICGARIPATHATG